MLFKYNDVKARMRAKYVINTGKPVNFNTPQITPKQRPNKQRNQKTMSITSSFSKEVALPFVKASWKTVSLLVYLDSYSYFYFSKAAFEGISKLNYKLL